MDNCIFCKIIRGEIPSRKVYEDKHTLSFMDVAMDVDGHILAVPKVHVKNILDCDPDTLAYLMNTVKNISNQLVDKCGYDGVNLLNASDESAGQSVPHFHIHIIPRKKDDRIDAWPAFNGAMRDAEQVYQEIIQGISD